MDGTCKWRPVVEGGQLEVRADRRQHSASASARFIHMYSSTERPAQRPAPLTPTRYSVQDFGQQRKSQTPALRPMTVEVEQHSRL